METPKRPTTRVRPPAKEMFVPRVLNKYRDAEEIKSFTADQMVDISRSGKWGNPFLLAKGASDEERADCILEYSEWLLSQTELLDSIPELTGKMLICTCKPKACHGDILLSLANPQKKKKIKRVITRVKAVDIESEEKQILTRINVHGASHTEHPEKVIEVPKEDEKKAEEVIESMGNWSQHDELWHFGSLSYNKESYQQSRDRIRLYYEWKYSHPGPDIYEPDAFSGFLAGFEIGAAYGREQITPEQIKEWKIQRAKNMVLDPQDPSFDDIPF